MSTTKLPLSLRFYGISPWELEVLYSILHNIFNVSEDPNANQDENFTTMMDITFTIDLDDRRSFDTAIDKIDFVLELLPYHFDPKKLPKEITEVSYQFDYITGKWIVRAGESGEQMYQFSENEWKIT
jgi:hypothetical protein